MAPGDMARLYHRLTSYEPEREWTTPVEDPRIVEGFTQIDLPTFPAPCKAYAVGLPRVELPRAWPSPGVSATAALAGVPVAPRRLDLDTLARVLFLSAGVVRTAESRDGRRYFFRAAGSAGGRSPFEVYVAARGVDGLADGVHWYDPVGHALLAVGPAPVGEATTLVITGIPWRTGWQYAERGFRHIYWDAGTLLAHLLALAGGSRLWTRFPDAEVTRLVGADGVHEWPVALVTLGAGAPAIGAGGEAVAGEVDRQPPLEFPLVTDAQRAGDGQVLGEPWPAAPALSGEPPRSADLEEVILRRGSTRFMDPAGTVSRELYAFSLAAALRGTRVPHYAAAFAVDGVAPGLYRWPDLDAPVRRAALREELFHVCMEQELARDAAFDVLGVIDLAGLDDRGYREAQLDAGIVEGRLHLAAYALGAGATGMTFYDSEIAGLIGRPLAGLLFTCVGVPAYRSKDGGRPGKPVPVERPQPRATS